MRAIITGGAGFIGINLAKYLLSQKWEVLIFDNLQRKGSKENLKWLKGLYKGENLKAEIADLKDFKAVKKEIEKAEVIYHLAGQVAVTSSLINPREDFESNLLGTFNILESARLSGHRPIIIFSSTNKVYGSLKNKMIKEGKLRYDFEAKEGVNEEENLDFYSPYGCSKGASDQYVRDYYRMYGIPTVVFRQSCIYGPRQMGVEDQGWAAHFAISGFLGKEINIYGNGKQVRDLLHVDDLISAYQKAVYAIDKSKGQIYNIGGGEKNSFSLLQYISFLEEILDKKVKVRFNKWRMGDQKVYISDNGKFKNELLWEPKISHKEGLKNLLNWVRDNKELFF